MSERLLRQLAAWIALEPVVMASVLHTQGAVPRRAGSRMLIAADRSAGSIGGGLAEARVLDAARALLRSADRAIEVNIDLDGGAGAAGICGGRMQLGLRRWHGDADAERLRQFQAELTTHGRAMLQPNDLGGGEQPQRQDADERLLIVGGGHCGEALYQLAGTLDFQLAVFDPRPDYANTTRFPDALCWNGNCSQLRAAVATPRRVCAVLLSRDYSTDIAALRVLAERPPDFIGMMGSRRRVHEVRRALAESALDFDRIQAPIGLEIAAETPQEIAVSVLAALIAWRRARGQS